MQVALGRAGLRRSAIATFLLLIALTAKAAPLQGCRSPIELQYGHASSLQRLDLYVPSGDRNTRSPLVIWIHGGALRMGDKSAMPRRNFDPAPIPKNKGGPYQVQVPDVSTLCRSGYAVASLNYRLGESMAEAAPDAIRDAKAAVRFLRVHAARLLLDERRFAAWGNSAGGYLVTMLAVTADRPSPFGDAQPTSDAIQAAVIWFGAEDRLGRELNPASYIPSAAHLPPVRIVNGDADPVVTASQARRLHEAFMRSGATSTLVILPGAGHEDPQFSRTQMEPTLEFLDQVFGR